MTREDLVTMLKSEARDESFDGFILELERMAMARAVRFAAANLPLGELLAKKRVQALADAIERGEVEVP